MKQTTTFLIGIVAFINFVGLMVWKPVLMGTLFGLFSLLFLILLALCNAAGRADEVKLEFQEVKSE